MRVITVNVPVTMLLQIDAVCGEEPEKFYPSRSEFFRVALRSFLTDYLKDHTVNLSPLNVPPSPPASLDLAHVHVKCEKISTNIPGRSMMDITSILNLIPDSQGNESF